MRLTHHTKVDYPESDRASLQISIHRSEHEIPIRISQEGIAEPLWLTWAEFDAVADLVWAYRPDASESGQSGVLPAVTYPICGHRSRHGNCVMSKGAHSRHINGLGRDVDTGEPL